MSGNPGFSCANVSAGTSCCTADNNCGEGLSGGPCYTCSYFDTTCAAGSTCPGGTAVSAACADRTAFDESPCACTALQELAALSPSLPTTAPWNDLANTAYCQYDPVPYKIFSVGCATVGGVQLRTLVQGVSVGLMGALPPNLRDLGPSLTKLDLRENAITSLPTELGALTGLTELWLGQNAITSVPTELGALTGLTSLGLYRNAITSVPSELGALTSLEELDLSDNQLTGVPTEFRTLDPSGFCDLSDNPGFSCANVGAGTSCCIGSPLNNCDDTSTCYTG